MSVAEVGDERYRSPDYVLLIVLNVVGVRDFSKTSPMMSSPPSVLSLEEGEGPGEDYSL